MYRSLLASLLGLAGALLLAGGAVAMPAGRLAQPRTRGCRVITVKHHRLRRCAKPVKRQGTQPPAARPIARPPSPAPSPSGGPPMAAPEAAPPMSPAGAASTAPPAPIIPPVPVPVPAPSAWDRPSLSNPTTVQISEANHVLVLSQSQDYIVECLPAPLALSAPLNIWGGHNVVLEDCDIELTNSDWAAHFSDQSGTLWIHDVHFGGSGLTGGVQLQEPGATVVMRDVLFDTVYGSQNTNHAELIQTWAGPARLMIDGLTGSTTYQGLFLEPNQYDNGPPPSVFDFRHVDIDDSRGAYALWLGDVSGSPPSDASAPILTWNVQDVYVVPNPARTWPGWWLWPQPSTGDPTWDGARAGAPPGGRYVLSSSSGATGIDENVSPPALVGEAP